ncbi:MATE family efflux transporter [Denitrobaculum tricleocarpae]|uniref:MATE family efflux transporter n=1 Tax=Denitrobaculum tricleocarpae TaxID=2591009 RepID=A0A545TKP0_9PROT|nr:MATE family efflux transporter [Denitrobaculum tricleocarpae]TQV77794.1 MATE family efflux transporter [Denitrobaculum tricleocarpae]
MSRSHAPGTQLILDAPIAKVLWRLATPNVVAVALWTAVTFADAWYVGQLGTAALASLALAFPFLSLMQMMAGGAIGGGITSAVARALGAAEVERAESTAWHAVLIGIAGSGVFMIFLGLFARPIFELLGGEGDALEGAVAYARVAFGGAAAIWFIFVLSAIHRGTGDTATPARAIAAASILQVFLSGALTLGWFGLPALGVPGTATALVVCQGSAAAYLAAHLFRGKGRVRLRPHALQWAPLRDIMRVGGLGLINSACMAMTVVVITGYVGRYGTEALAGYGLGARLELMLVPIAFGVGAALTAAVGINVGAGQFARARRFAFAGAGITLVLTGALGLSVAILPGLWLDLFTADPGAYAYGVTYLAIAAPFYGLFGAGQAFYFASQGNGRMVLPVSVTVIRFLTVAGIGAVAVSLAWEVTALFAAVAVGLTIMGVGQALCVLGPGWRGH